MRHSSDAQTRPADAGETFPSVAVRAAPRRTSLVVLVLASLLGACVVAQVFFAGLALFVDPLYWRPHRGLGHLLVPAALALLAVAAVGRQPPRVRWLAAALVVLLVAQGALASIRGLAGALHPVNALLILGVVVALATEARTAWRAAA